jgi:dTDP-4-dehydrorhamnose reductase
VTVRVAVTGSTGRLGGAVVRVLGEDPRWEAVPWTRDELDLDRPETARPAIERTSPDIVVHCAAWTDVDGCAREPELAERRNGLATSVLAEECARAEIGLLTVSTNEVFDGRRTDRRPYEPSDEPAPGNPYGRSKLLAEQGARAAFATATAPLWIARTAWLFGRPGKDFPMKIIDAARAAAAEGRTLSLVDDEIGTPTFAGDVARAIVDLLGHPGSAGVHHLVNAGHASRADWARHVLARAGVEVATANVSMDAWPRPSVPPRWGVLAPTPLPTIGHLRAWEDALDEDLGMRLVG